MYLLNTLHILCGIGVGIGTTNTNLINPQLAVRLVTEHLLLIMPTISINSYTELVIPVIIQQSRLDSLLIRDLGSVKPRLKLARRIALPLDAEHEPVPNTSLDSVKQVDVVGSLRALLPIEQGTAFHARNELGSIQPDHGRGAEIIAALPCLGILHIPKVCAELRNVVALGLEVPVWLQEESETVVFFLVTLVALGVVLLRMVAARVAAADVGGLEFDGFLAG